MTPALRHNSKTTVKDGFINLVAKLGLKFTSPKILAILMFKFDYKPISQFR